MTRPTFNKPAEKIFYWQIKTFQTKPLSCGNGWRFPMLPPRLLAKTMSRGKQDEKGVLASGHGYPEVGARSLPGSGVPELLVGCHGVLFRDGA